MATKEEFFRDYEIMKMNRNSLSVMERKTSEMLLISRNAFNAITANKAECVLKQLVEMPDGRTTKWLAIVTTTIF